MTKLRLDTYLAYKKLVPTRSQAEGAIKLGSVTINGKVVTKPGTFVPENAVVRLNEAERYVSRAGLKLASVAQILKLDFRDKTVLDVGTDQLHPSLRRNSAIELHEKTDIRDFYLEDKPDIVVIDVSFISLREILPHLARELTSNSTHIAAMLKPQFEAGKDQTNKGIIKNDAVRRQILRDFEQWAKQYFVIVDKRDSDVAGAKGNQERFYLLKTIR